MGAATNGGRRQTVERPNSLDRQGDWARWQWRRAERRQRRIARIKRARMSMLHVVHQVNRSSSQRGRDRVDIAGVTPFARHLAREISCRTSRTMEMLGITAATDRIAINRSMIKATVPLPRERDSLAPLVQSLPADRRHRCPAMRGCRSPGGRHRVSACALRAIARDSALCPRNTADPAPTRWRVKLARSSARSHASDIPGEGLDCARTATSATDGILPGQPGRSSGDQVRGTGTQCDRPVGFPMIDGFSGRRRGHRPEK